MAAINKITSARVSGIILTDRSAPISGVTDIPSNRSAQARHLFRGILGFKMIAPASEAHFFQHEPAPDGHQSTIPINGAL